MGNRSDRSDVTAPDSTERSRSIAYELLVWIFLAPPVGLLGVTAADAIAGSTPLSWTGALVLVGGLAVVGSALLSDFQPSLLAAFGFFVLDQFLLGFLYFTGQVMIPSGSTLSPWEEVGLQALAISVAAVLAFTNVGRGSERLDRLTRRLLRLPPGDRSGASSDDERRRR